LSELGDLFGDDAFLLVLRRLFIVAALRLALFRGRTLCGLLGPEDCGDVWVSLEFHELGATVALESPTAADVIEGAAELVGREFVVQPFGTEDVGVLGVVKEECVPLWPWRR
jgi:hypothetical protein